MKIRWAVALILVVSLIPLAAADVAKRVPQEYLDAIVDDNPNPLPRYMTSEERLMPLPKYDDFRAPPTGVIHTPAEYEQSSGMMISWGSFNSILTELTVGVTTGDPDAIVYILVDDASQQSSAELTLVGAGADMSQVEFITYATDSVWIRDYGPRFIFEDGVRAIVDHTYNRPSRLNDNAVPDLISSLWGDANYDMPITHGGGNFQHFTNHDADMTTLILAENPSLTEQDVKDLYFSYQNQDVAVREPLPVSFDSTQHIDMWFLPVGDDEVIIGEYDIGTGLPYTITEAAVTDLVTAGYTIHRTPGWNSGGTHYTYTNAVIVNDLVFMPEYSGYATENAQALAVFEAAYAGMQIIPVDCSDIIDLAGAIHCIVMQVPAITDTMVVTPGTDLESAGPVGGPFTPSNVIYTLENQSDGAINYSVTKTQPWLDLTNASGSIPAQSTVQVTLSVNAAASGYATGFFSDTITFENLTDHSGDTVRQATLAIGDATAVETFPFDSDPGWTTEGLWAFGVPAGGGGTNGSDPTGGHTGNNVYGYNLAGDYANNLAETHLTSTAIDCSGIAGAELRFWRWLGVEVSTWDHAYLRISTDGSTWETLWQNSAEVYDGTWVEQIFDISGIADGEAQVYLRWTMGETDTVDTWCGWNIDDVEIWGLPPGTVGETPVFADGFESGDITAWSLAVE